MCRPLSGFAAMIGCEVKIWVSEATDSHTAIAEEFCLRDTPHRRLYAFEFYPGKAPTPDTATWTLAWDSAATGGCRAKPESEEDAAFRAAIERLAMRYINPATMDSCRAWCFGGHILRGQTGGIAWLYNQSQSHGQTGGWAHMYGQSQNHGQAGGIVWLFDQSQSHGQTGGEAYLYGQSQSHGQTGGWAHLLFHSQSHGQTGGKAYLYDQSQSYGQNGGEAWRNSQGVFVLVS